MGVAVELAGKPAGALSAKKFLRVEGQRLGSHHWGAAWK